MAPQPRSRRIFGVPASLARQEARDLDSALRALWDESYGGAPGDFDTDVELCRRYFDPLARGQSIRDRLAGVGGPVRFPATVASYMVPPLVLEIGDDKHLVGIEARLVLDVLASHSDESLVSFSLSECIRLEADAADFYRNLATARLRDVIALRRGIGKEVMQAVSVGVVLILLINRSTSPQRAQVDRGGRLESIDNAVYLSAETFADAITKGRGRSQGEKRLKGGYALSEARRRLAERLIADPVKPKAGEDRRIYLAEGSEDDVITFLANDLARRPGLDTDTLANAFDSLVEAFRRQSKTLATHSGVHERPAETARIRKALIERFTQAKPPIIPTR